MNYELVVNTDDLKMLLGDMENIYDEYNIYLDYIADYISNVHNHWTGEDADEFVNSFQDFHKDLKKISTFYEEMMETIREENAQYERVDQEYSTMVRNEVNV